MPSHRATDSGTTHEASDRGYFAPLKPAKYTLLTTFKPDGTPVSTPVCAAADGDRAYFRTWNTSGLCERLRHNGFVQAVPCSALGLYSYGPSLDATARRLTGEEASRAAGLLARTYPGQHRLLSSMVRRIRGGQTVHYELLAEGESRESP